MFPALAGRGLTLRMRRKAGFFMGFLGRAALAALCVFAGVVAVPVANAEGPPVQPQAPLGYALVVGSNAGGAGQAPLQYAEQDATRVAQTLVEVGRFEAQHVTQLVRPTREQLSRALDQLEQTLHAEAAAGRKTTVVIYYSGHARAQALNLGSELFELSELRARILRLPGDLKLVILDACQSGAFSSPKGAQPAADFSFNSVEQLRTAGIAVMASSSASELSQESERLQASYFTHHMLVALRGGGDANHDGRVTLAETYQYAYHRTLVATSETAIGGQHVTLETELRGQGDVALSYPAPADARLILPRTLRAEVIVTQLPSRSVVAETHKAAGAELTLALPSGHYAVIVREDSMARRCDVALTAGAPTVLTTATCAVIAEPIAAAKGGEADGPRPTWSLHLGIGLGNHNSDAYEGTLESFGYSESGNGVGRFLVSGAYAVSPYLMLGGQFQNLDYRQFSRDTQGVSQNFEWHAYGFGPFLRVQPAWRRLIPYLEASAGLTLAKATLDLSLIHI